MWRTIGAVVLGYFAMAIPLFVAFMILPDAIGLDNVLKPGSYEPSVLFSALTLGAGLLTAVFGGYVCMAVAKKRNAAIALALLVLALGLGTAFVTLVFAANDDAPPARPANASFADASEHSKEPPWVTLAIPWIGAAGIAIGAWLKGRKRSLPDSA